MSWRCAGPNYEDYVQSVTVYQYAGFSKISHPGGHWKEPGNLCGETSGPIKECLEEKHGGSLQRMGGGIARRPNAVYGRQGDETCLKRFKSSILFWRGLV